MVHCSLAPSYFSSSESITFVHNAFAESSLFITTSPTCLSIPRQPRLILYEFYNCCLLYSTLTCNKYKVSGVYNCTSIFDSSYVIVFVMFLDSIICYLTFFYPQLLQLIFMPRERNISEELPVPSHPSSFSRTSSNEKDSIIFVQSAFARLASLIISKPT